MRKAYDIRTGQTIELPDLPAEQIDTTPIVPRSVTMRQARLALLAAGKLDDVEAAINALPEPPKTPALIEWNYSNEVLRHNGFVSQIAPLIGMTPADLDAIFIEAAKL